MRVNWVNSSQDWGAIKMISSMQARLCGSVFPAVQRAHLPGRANQQDWWELISQGRLLQTKVARSLTLRSDFKAAIFNAMGAVADFKECELKSCISTSVSKIRIKVRLLIFCHMYAQHWKRIEEGRLLIRAWWTNHIYFNNRSIYTDKRVSVKGQQLFICVFLAKSPLWRWFVIHWTIVIICNS